MGIFSRKDRVVDLSEDYHYERKKLKDSLKITSPSTSPAQTQESSAGGFFNFFGSVNSQNSSSSPSSSSDIQSPTDFNENETEPLAAHEKRKRLAKRLKDMTDKIEDLSNQIYLLQQKIELIETKININKYE